MSGPTIYPSPRDYARLGVATREFDRDTPLVCHCPTPRYRRLLGPFGVQCDRCGRLAHDDPDMIASQLAARPEPNP